MRIAITARSVALQLLNKVYVEAAYANLAMPGLLTEAKLPDRDSAFAQELGFSTIRWQLTYDRIIGQVSSRGLSEIEPVLLNGIRLGVHQLLQMRVPAHAAINETVNLIRQACGEKVVGFANGVLRRISEKSLADWIDLLENNLTSEIEVLSLRYSHPEWIVRALQQSLKSDGIEKSLPELLASNNAPALVTMVALPGLSDRNAFLTEGALPTYLSPYGFLLDSGNPSEIPEVRTGEVRVQDEGSQIAALALISPKPVGENETWLDMCAGPGGKAALLAALARENGAKLYANESQEHRTELVRKAMRPFPEVEVRTGDGREIGEANPEAFDRILLDAPCTGLGALRRRPEARWRKSAEDLKGLTELQFQLLESAYQALKPGGLLLYVTCSPHLSETTAVVSRAIKDLGAQALDLTESLNETYFGGILPNGRKTVQLYTHRDGTDCMFMALLTK
jgi:16S rRNA (cytosine967-C5)-methyltransferase